MKRCAIILGHVDGHLSTNLDMKRVYDFLVSCNGGAWDSDEIIKKANATRREVIELFDNTRAERFDYVFFYFSGHGGYKRGTVVELNPTGEILSEAELVGLGSRQLNIFDCCRKPDEEGIVKESMSFSMDSLWEDESRHRAYCRHLFENRTMLAAPQEMSLYACSIGEYANDTNNGGIYTKHLINAACNVEEEYLLASAAHDSAYLSTVVESTSYGQVQHPDYFMAKLPSRLQLVIAVNANKSL